MNLADVQERARKLGIDSPSFQWLSNERLFMQGGAGVNIASPEHQAALSAMLPDGSVLIIDNLSTAQLGMDENDNDAFDAIRDWLLSLRQRSITVLIVHHAGRNGQMRGASRREDMAHWIVSLKDTSDDDRKAKTFTTSFVKVRNCPEREAPVLQWTLKDDGETIAPVCKPFSGPEAVYALIAEGCTGAGEIAAELGVTAGTVSKWAGKLIASGRVRKAGRDYQCTG
jgi:putative DNA primase/helicase